MKCSKAERLWEDWLGGNAPPELERHLAECPRCREQAQALQKTSAWLALLEQESPELSPSFWPRLWLQESEAQADFWAALAAVARPATAALSLALLLLLLTVWVLPQGAEPATAVVGDPQPYWEEVAGADSPGNGEPNRDQVVLTLVSYSEASR